MFVRFRPIYCRLAVILVANHREGSRVRQDHIVRLGSAVLPEPISVRERERFWIRLHERLPDLAARLGDRVSADDWRKALASIHSRIPKPTAAEEQAARSADQAPRRAIAAIERQLADACAVKAAELVAAQARFVTFKRGKRAAGEPAKQRENT
jgi:hypothetical protein